MYHILFKNNVVVDFWNTQFTNPEVLTNQISKMLLEQTIDAFRTVNTVQEVINVLNEHAPPTLLSEGVDLVKRWAKGGTITKEDVKKLLKGQEKK